MKGETTAMSNTNIFTSAAKGREIIEANPGNDLLLSEIAQLYDIMRDDPTDGRFNALGIAFDYGVYVGAQLKKK